MLGSGSSPWRRLALKTRLTFHAVTDLGASTAAAIAVNSLRSARLERLEARAGRRAAVPRTPGRLCATTPVPNGVRCRFEEAELEVVFLADDLVRIDWGPGAPPLPWALNGPLATGEGPADPTVSVTTGPGSGCVVTGRGLQVEVTTSGELRYYAGDRLVRHELAPLRRGSARTSRFWLRRDERLAGLGEQAGPVDLRGSTHRLWNRDPGGAYGPGEDPLYLGIPVLVGLHPEGDVLSFHENSYEAVVRLGARRGVGGPGALAELTFAGGRLRHYVTAGPLPRLLDRYSALTGRPPLPPRWALGFHQCRWGYRTQADARGVSEGFTAEGLPLSALYLDIDYMDGYRVFTVDRRRFPDLAGLSADLLGTGTRLVTIVDPAVKEEDGYGLFEEGRRGGHFLRGPEPDDGPFVGVVWPGPAVYPDFTDPAVRRWWGGQYRDLLDQGVAGIWHDMNEPTSITLWGDRTLPRSVPHQAEGRGGDHRECHNVYGLLMNRAGWEALAEQRPDRRPFVVSRSGWAGLARWAWNWTADIESSWEGLRQQVATAIGLGLSGVPYTGSDTGGFSGVPTPELFVRWLELAVTMPFCRTHSVTGAPPREPWCFPEPHRSHIGRLIRFRYRLLPYLYALAEETSRTGVPLVRPLCWGESPEGSSADRALWQVDDAFFLGDALLVAPVTRAGADSRAVVLPAGRWYGWDGVTGPPAPAPVVEGGRIATLPAPLGRPVTLVREGSVVALDDGWAEAGGAVESSHAPRRLAFHCFPDGRGDARGSAYDDAGDGFGPGRRDLLELSAAEDAGALFTWRTDGAFERPAEVAVVVHGLAVSRAIADGQEVDVEVAGPPGATGPTSTVSAPAFERLTLEYR